MYKPPRNNYQISTIQPLVEKYLTPHFTKIERYLIYLLLLAIIIRIANLKSLFFLFDISLSLLSLLYFFNAFSPLPKKLDTDKNRFTHYITFWSLATCLIGVLFKAEHFPGNTLMLIISGVSLLFIAFYTGVLFSKSTDQSSFYRGLMYRGFAFAILALFFKFGSHELLQELNLIMVPIL